MTYTLSWLDNTGVLHEQSLALQGLLSTLPGLRARATVVGETGIVCGGVRERLDHRTQRWEWSLELAGAAPANGRAFA